VWPTFINLSLGKTGKYHCLLNHAAKDHLLRSLSY